MNNSSLEARAESQAPHSEQQDSDGDVAMHDRDDEAQVEGTPDRATRKRGRASCRPTSIMFPGNEDDDDDDGGHDDDGEDDAASFLQTSHATVSVSPNESSAPSGQKSRAGSTGA